MSEAAELLAWDTEWLGFQVAQFLVPPHCPATELAAIVNRCRANGVRLLYLKLNPADARAAAAAAAASVGAWLSDEKLTFELPLLQASALSTPQPGIQLTRATETSPALEQLALQSGAHSRFRRDARIGAKAFASLYTQWLQQCLRHGIVWVAASESKPIGLLAFASRGNYGSIELVAVAPEARGQGIGQELVRAAGQEAQQMGFPTLQVVTQAANEPAQALYRRCGFRLAHAVNVYHLWL